MQEEISLQLEQINETVTPFLCESLKDIDYKPVIIYFSGLLKTLMIDLDDEDFNQLIIKYIKDDINVSL